MPLDLNRASGHPLDQGFLRRLAERLVAFGRINPGQPDPVLNPVRVQHGHRVAVSHLDHLARQGFPRDGHGHDQHEPNGANGDEVVHLCLP